MEYRRLHFIDGNKAERLAITYTHILPLLEVIFDRRNQAICYGYLAEVYINMYDFPEAKEHVKRAIEISLDLEDSRARAEWMATYGIIKHF
jgi:tetratricopeptide (TPR) repeat protein